MPKAHAAEIHPVQMTKILRDVFPRPSGSPQLCKTPRQEGAGRLFCITGTQDRSQSRECHRHSRLKGIFPEVVWKGQSAPQQATPGSVGYDLFTPIDFQNTTKRTENCFHRPRNYAT